MGLGGEWSFFRGSFHRSVNSRHGIWIHSGTRDIGACYLIALSAMIIAIAQSTHEPHTGLSGSPNAQLFG